MNRKRVGVAVAGAAGGVLTLGAALIGGHAFAQTPGGGNASPTPSAAQQQRQTERDQFLNDLAKNLGIDRSKLDSALKTTASQEVDAAVAAGKLTQAQADQIKQRINSSTEPIGFGLGIGHERGGGAGIPAGVLQAAQAAVSKDLGGETWAQVMQDLQSGKTPDQIAQEHNTTVAQVRGDVAAAVQPLLDQAVQQGTLTQAQEQRILDMIKNGNGFGFGVGMGGMHRGGRGNANPPATPGATQ